MSKSIATSATITGTPRIFVSLSHGNNGFEATRVETYFRFSVEWRGKVIEASITADTYQHSSGWSEQRLSGISAPSTPLSDTARTSIREVVEPLILEWLNGPEYHPTRRRAYASSIASQIRRDMYANYAELVVSADLEATDRETLLKACEAKSYMLDLLGTVGKEPD